MERLALGGELECVANLNPERKCGNVETVKHGVIAAYKPGKPILDGIPQGNPTPTLRERDNFSYPRADLHRDVGALIGALRNLRESTKTTTAKGDWRCDSCWVDWGRRSEHDQ